MNLKGGLLKKTVQWIGMAAPLFDFLFSPLTIVAVVWFRIVRYWAVKKMPVTKWLFLKLGVFPIVNHYYEPLFDFRKISYNKKGNTLLDLRVSEQLVFLDSLKSYSHELNGFPLLKKTEKVSYYYKNGSFQYGDGELYYSIIRKNRPQRILEIGSGFSTLMALEAITKNETEHPTEEVTQLTCIEPYEMPFLEGLNIHLIREKIEDVIPSVFSELHDNDILFIDSSHIIRPGGDVNYLILKILPTLNKGVWIHFHDIFIPDNYPVEWLRDEFRLWNEQYLLEALLLNNEKFEIICAMHYLNATYKKEVNCVFPVLAAYAEDAPSSFWIRRK